MKWQCAVERRCVGAVADGEIEKKNYIQIRSVRGKRVVG